MFGVFWTNGQICSSTSRLLIHENIAKSVLERLVIEIKKIYVGGINKKSFFFGDNNFIRSIY